ncbi:hypothetical protein LR48_Vigan02g079600 [Vigna angularis]|uniref:Uncharacterized protein n=1 Tax=Phaseolus angularis TaxID=3914 RepID=A0A0L9TVY9_PHAAN|nr:hypothetical protein LR48_Vigan02g079600 [Vigna angularis]
MSGINKMTIYRDCLRSAEEPRDFTLFKVGGLKKNERLCAFIIAWILLPRGGNHAKLSTKDVYLLHALRDKFKKQDDKVSKLQRSLFGLHRKLYYGIRINAFSKTSEDVTKDEEIKTDDDYKEISDSK